MTIDMLIKNGHVIDPARDINAVDDVAICGNRIVPVDENVGKKAKDTVDASGCYVFPGLIDFHTHIFWGGAENGVLPLLMSSSGVTATVDAGSSGCLNYCAFRKSVEGMVRVKNYLSCCSVGLAGTNYHENFNPNFFDFDRIAMLKSEYPEDILGLKIRIPRQLVIDLHPLEKALELAEKVGNMSVCVHVTNAPASMEDVAKLLRKGDIFCHVYHGTGDTILDTSDRVLPEIHEARKRGVVFDMSNGQTNFSNAVCIKALKDGFLPDVIATDMGINRFHRGLRARSLPFVMSKLLNFGMSLTEIVRCVTQTPAALMRMQEKIGTLAPGAFADICIMKKVARQVTFDDVFGDVRQGNKLLVPQMTFLNGNIVFAQGDFDL